MVVDNLANYSGTIDKILRANEKIFLKRRKKDILDSRGWFKQPNDRWKLGNWINCDLRYFDLNLLQNMFEVVYVDPPWRLQKNELDESKLYNSLSDQEIKDIQVGKLSKSGFIFMWVPSSKLDVGLELISHWGYTYVDRVNMRN